MRSLTAKTLSFLLILALALTIIPYSADAADLINTDFDDGTTQGWAKSSGTGSIGVSPNGYDDSAYSLQVSGNVLASYSLGQSITSYEIDFYFYILSTSANSLYLWSGRCGDGSYLGAYVAVKGTNSSLMYSDNGGSHYLGITVSKETWHHIHIVSDGQVFSLDYDESRVGTDLDGRDSGFSIEAFEIGAATTGYFRIDEITSGGSEPATWAPEFTSTPDENATIGTNYTYEPTTNETSTITAEEIPDWLTFEDGILSGDPNETGEFNCSLKAVSTNGTLPAYQNWTIIADEAPIPTPQFLNAPDTTANERVWYEWTPQTDLDCAFTLETFPSWLHINTLTGTVYGTPNAGGNFTVSLRAVSLEYGTNSTLTYYLLVDDALPPPPPPDDETGTDDPGTTPGSMIFGLDNTTLLVLAALVTLAIIVIAARRRK